jgi:hypothetical protein
MSKEWPKVLNPPERIYLQVGDIEEDCDFENCDEVTWCQDSIHNTDIEYRLVKRPKKR